MRGGGGVSQSIAKIKFVLYSLFDRHSSFAVEIGGIIVQQHLEVGTLSNVAEALTEAPTANLHEAICDKPDEPDELVGDDSTEVPRMEHEGGEAAPDGHATLSERIEPEDEAADAKVSPESVPEQPQKSGVGKKSTEATSSEPERGLTAAEQPTEAPSTESEEDDAAADEEPKPVSARGEKRTRSATEGAADTKTVGLQDVLSYFVAKTLCVFLAPWCVF